MNDKLNELLNRPDILEKLKNSINTNNISQRVYQPTINEIQARKNEDDCPNYQICTNLNIAKPSICSKGGETRAMCSFGESRIILLLSQLLSNEQK